jgi:hypothetical protein
MIKHELTFQLVLDEPDHILLPKVVKRHKVRLAKRAFMVELSLKPFINL